MKHVPTKTLSLSEGSPEEKRNEIIAYFQKTWQLDEQIYTQLRDDSIFYHRGDDLRHILLFYLGHTAVFYINKLFLSKIINTRVNPEFESLFAIGVDEMSWDDLNNKHYNWPSVDAVRKYRKQVQDVVMNVIKTLPLSLPIQWDDPFWIVVMGIEHERIHIETSSVLIRQLPIDEVVSGRFGIICTQYADAPQNEMLFVPGETVSMGKPENDTVYGWDNEYGEHTEKVSDFYASKYLVSNGEFLSFIEDNGYWTQGYWTEEGWSWRNFKHATMPLFWRKKDDAYYLRLVAEEIPMPWNWPVEINQLEAKAFSNWKTAKEGKTYRLPTEAEYVRLARYCDVPDILNWKSAPGNINLEHFSSPCPVDLFPIGDFYDVIGNVWQWTETPITGYAGFKVHAMYDDFSTPTFDGKHNIIKGGSFISTGNEATKHARYAFRRHFYQHAGLRLIQSDAEIVIQKAEYEMDTEVSNNCESLWSNTNTPSFHAELAAYIRNNIANLQSKKVLDVNTDTGKLAFELVDAVQSITAIDFSARFIRIPIQLQENGFMRYIVADENDLVHYREVVIPKEKLEQVQKKVVFLQDNANNLKPIHTGFDLIIVPNALEEMNNPLLFLSTIHERLNENGTLLITSSYNWKRNNIQPDYWLGGYKKDGEPFTALDAITTILEKHFTLVNIPFSLENKQYSNSREYTVTICEVSMWQRKS
ncbi:MAG: 5-histidylcysteine sulfoxide synthase [Paludibacteraceae bacterium]|nr:5-histidylcysteine sulfoxide synthase [Paludibacteraceae bacterium]